MNHMKKWIKWLGNTLTVISVLFILRSIRNLGFDFSAVTNPFAFVFILICGIIIKSGTVFISACIWGNWVSFFARKRCKANEVLTVYTKANIGKYLPGNIMQFVERNLFADKMHVGHAEVVASSFIEAISLIIVAFIIALLTSRVRLGYALHSLPIQLNRISPLFILPLLLILIAIVTFAFSVFRNRIFSVLKNYSFPVFIKVTIINAFGQAIVLSLLGSIFLILYFFMGGRCELEGSLLIIGSYIISWVLGFVVPGAPGGIGIREYVIQILISPLIGAELTLTISIIHRLITIAGDFVAYLIGTLLAFNREKDS